MCLIIFITHSLREIVVKRVGCFKLSCKKWKYWQRQALIHSDAVQQGTLKKHWLIKLLTYDIFFIKTSHQGNSEVHFRKLMLKMAFIFVTVNDKILKHLKWDSEWLQQQLDQYALISHSFVIKFTYEMFSTSIALRKTIMVCILHCVSVSNLLVSGYAAGFSCCIQYCRCKIDGHISRSP